MTQPIGGLAAIQSRVTELRSLMNNRPSAGQGNAQVLGNSLAFESALASALGSAEAETPGLLPTTSGLPANLSTNSVAKSLGAKAAPVAGMIPNPYSDLFTTAGVKHGISPVLLAAVAKTESNFNPNAKSSAGALGLMQFMPGTAKGLNVDPMNPASAIDGAARMLSGLVKKFGSTDLALAGYNAGPGAVQKYGGIPPYKETQNYVKKINALLNQGVQ